MRPNCVYEFAKGRVLSRGGAKDGWPNTDSRRRRDFRRAPHAYAYRNQPLSTWTSRYDRVDCLVSTDLPTHFHISPSHPGFFQSEECGYCCLTVIALSIAFCSAVITFLVANHMYTGLPCHDDPQPFALNNEELSWDGSDRLVVANKRIIVVRLDDLKRCYLLPSRLAQDTNRQQFEIIPEPLTKAIGTHFAGPEGWKFCDGLPVFLLEESKS
ncbi:hypothetical protein Aduo_019654 [Ancylostoma duodenale]